MRPFGFGIAGTGMIAAFHARAIHSLPDARLVGVASRSLESAQRFCAAQGGEPYASLDALLARPDLDVLLVATPSGAHLAPVLSAAAAGKHVLCEKPLEITTERIDRMVAAHASAGTRLGCIFQFRFLPAVQTIRSALQAGRFGNLTFGGAFVPWWREPSYYTGSPWHGKRDLDGGTLMNQAIHVLDLLCDLMPPVVSAKAHFAVNGHTGLEAEDAATASLRFEGGALGLVHGTTSFYPGLPKRLEIAGTDGSAVLTDNALSHFAFRRPLPDDASTLVPASPSATGAARPDAMTHDLHAACFAAFRTAVETGAPFVCEGPSARKSVALIEQLRKSAEAEI